MFRPSTILGETDKDEQNSGFISSVHDIPPDMNTPELVLTGNDIETHYPSSTGSSPVAISTTPMSPALYPWSPPASPGIVVDKRLDGSPVASQALTYSQGLSAQQQLQYVDSLASGSPVPDEYHGGSVEAEAERILQGEYTRRNKQAEAIASTLLPSHMSEAPKRSSMPSSTTGRRQSLGATLQVTFTDDDMEAQSPPSTPKGHPEAERKGISKYVDLNRHMRRVQRGRGKLLGLLNVSEEPENDRRGSADLKRGKIYRPVQHAHTAALSSHTGFNKQTFQTTLSRFARIPRKYRPLVAGFICFILLGTITLRWNGERVESQRQAQARQYSRGIQKAFVIGEKGYDADHHDANKADRLKDSEILDAFGTEDIADAAPDTTFIELPKVASSDDDDYVFEFKDKIEETAALFSFLTSSSSNSLPKVDPSLPLDPQLVLDFDYTKAATARLDMEQLAEDVWQLFPLVIIGKMRDPYHREVLKVMSHYVTNPPPLIIEVDQRRDAATLVPILSRLLDVDTFPQIVVNGRSIGGYKEIVKYQEDKTIKEYFGSKGIEMKDKKKKKIKYIKDSERREMERILGPKPIAEAPVEALIQPEEQ